MAPSRLLREAGADPVRVRMLAEQLEQRVMLAGFSPGGTPAIGIENVATSRVLSAVDVTTIDIASASSYDRVQLNANVALNGVLKLNFLNGFSLGQNQVFEIFSNSGGSGTITGAFLAAGQVVNPTMSGFNLVLVQSPANLRLVATDLPVANFTVSTTTAAEADNLVAMFLGGSSNGLTDSTMVDGTIHAIGQRASGRLTFSETNVGMGVAGVDILLRPRGPQEADLGRITVSVNQTDVASVFGQGDFTLRGGSDAASAGLRLTTFTQAGFTLAPGYGGVSSPASNTIPFAQIGPLKFTFLAAAVPEFVLVRNGNGHDEVDVGVGFAAQKLELAFSSGAAGAAGQNTGGVKAEATDNVQLALGFEATFDGNAVSLGTASGAFSVAAGIFNFEIPNVIKITSSAGISAAYNPDDPAPDQQIFSVTTLFAEIPKLKLKAGVDSPSMGTSAGLTVYKNGFKFGEFTATLDTSTFGAMPTMTTDTDGFLSIGSALRIKNPALVMNRFAMTFNDDGSIADASADSIGIQVEAIRVGPAASEFYAEAMALRVSVTFPGDDITQPPDGLRISADSLDVNLGRFIRVSATSILLDTTAADNERLLIVNGNFGVTLDLSSLFGQSGTGLALTGTVGGFAIKGNGAFEPFTSMSEAPYNLNPFRVSLDVNATNIGGLLGGVQFPSFLSSFGGFSASVTIIWPNFTADPARFLMELDLSLDGAYPNPTSPQFTFNFSVEDLLIDSGRLLSTPVKFPIIGVGLVSGSLNATIGGAMVNGTIVFGVAKFNADGEALSNDEVRANPDQVGQSVIYVGARGGFMLANGYGVNLSFGVSERGFLQAYMEARVPVLLDPNTGLTISNFRGGLTFNATPFPAITDPFLLRSPLFKPTRDLTQEQWEDQLGLLVANQLGGNPGFLFKVKASDVTDMGGIDAWFNALDSTNDPGIVLPAGLRAKLLTQGFAFTTKAGLATTVQLDAGDMWLLDDRGQEYLMIRNRADNSLSVYTIGFSIAEDNDDAMDTYSVLTAITGDTPAGSIPGLIDAFMAKDIVLPPDAVVRIRTAGQIWEIDDGVVVYTLKQYGITGPFSDFGNKILSVTGGNGAFGADSVIKIEAGFTLYSQYATEGAFAINADAIVTTDGKFVLKGDLTFGDATAAGQNTSAISIQATIFFDLTQILAGTAQILFLGDVTLATATSPIVSIYGRLTFAFYKRNPIPGEADFLIDLAYLQARGFSTIEDLFLDNLANDGVDVLGNDPDYFKIELAGSETQGVSVVDSAGIPGLGAFAAQRLRLGGKAIVREPGDTRESYGFAALSFDIADRRFVFEFDANISAEGLIAAQSIVSAAGKFELKFGTAPDGSTVFEYLYGAAKLNARTDDIEPLALAGVQGEFNATLKINTSSFARNMVLALPGREVEMLNLRKESFGLFASAALIFRPPVIGGFLHQEIVGAFALEVDGTGFQLFVLGSGPVPLPLVGAAVSPLKADILGVMLFKRRAELVNGLPVFDFAARLEMAIRTDLAAGVSQYFDLQMDLQLFINTSGQDQSYQLPEDFGQRFIANIPAALVARLNVRTGPDGQIINDVLSITVPGGAPRLGWSPSNDVTDPDGAYITILGEGSLFIGDPGTYGAAIQVTGARLRLSFGTAGFGLEVGGSVILGPFANLTVSGVLDIAPQTLGGTDYAAWGSFQLAGSFNIDQLSLAVAASLDINTSSTTRQIKHYYDPATRTVIPLTGEAMLVDLPAHTLQFFAGGNLAWSGTVLVAGEFTFVVNPEGLEMTVVGVTRLQPLVDVSISGAMILTFNGNSAGFLRVNAGFTLPGFSFTGNIFLAYNTFDTLRDFTLPLVSGTVRVEANSFLFFVDGSLNLTLFGANLLSLNGRFFISNTPEKLSVLVQASLGLNAFFGSSLNVGIGGSADLYKSGPNSGALVLDVSISSLSLEIPGVVELALGGAFFRLNTGSGPLTSGLGNSVPRGMEIYAGSLSLTLVGIQVASGTAFIRYQPDAPYAHANGDWVFGASLSFNFFNIVTLSGSLQLYSKGAFYLDIDSGFTLGTQNFGVSGNVRITASYLAQNFQPAPNGDPAQAVLNASDLFVSGSFNVDAYARFKIAGKWVGITIGLGGNLTYFAGALSLRACIRFPVIGEKCKTFSLGRIDFNPAPPVRLASPLAGGDWPASGGVLYLNVGGRANLRNLLPDETEEDYTIVSFPSPP